MILLLIYFLINFITEFLIIYLITKFKWKELLLDVFLINLFTWPLATIAFSFEINFYLVEFVVVIVESLLLLGLLRKRYLYCLGLSLVANFVTAAMSFLI